MMIAKGKVERTEPPALWHSGNVVGPLYSPIDDAIAEAASLLDQRLMQEQ